MFITSCQRPWECGMPWEMEWWNHPFPIVHCQTGMCAFHSGMESQEALLYTLLRVSKSWIFHFCLSCGTTHTGSASSKTPVSSHVEKGELYHFTLKHSRKNLMQFHVEFCKSAGMRSLSNGFGCTLEFTVPISIELRLQTFSGNFPSFISNECTVCFQLLKCWLQNEKWLSLS